MSDQPYSISSEENRKIESRESKAHGGNVPADSEASLIKSKQSHPESESKQSKIDRVQANLPLPEDPPTAPDWNSADSRTVNVGSGRVQDDVAREMAKGSESGLREPATAESSVRVDGEQMKKATAP